MKELDQLLLRWLDRRWPEAESRQRQAFERLIETEDDQLWRWCMGRERPKSRELQALVDDLRTLTSN